MPESSKEVTCMRRFFIIFQSIFGLNYFEDIWIVALIALFVSVITALAIKRYRAWPGVVFFVIYLAMEILGSISKTIASGLITLIMGAAFFGLFVGWGVAGLIKLISEKNAKNTDG